MPEHRGGKDKLVGVAAGLHCAWVISVDGNVTIHNVVLVQSGMCSPLIAYHLGTKLFSHPVDISVKNITLKTKETLMIPASSRLAFGDCVS